MAHAQKPDLVFQHNGQVNLNWRRGGGSVQSIAGSRVVRISGSNGSNAGYTMFLGRVQDYWLPTPFAYFPILASPCAIRFQLSYSNPCVDTVMVILYKLESNPHPNLIRNSFYRFLKQKKSVRGSNPHLSFNRPLSTRQTD